MKKAHILIILIFILITILAIKINKNEKNITTKKSNNTIKITNTNNTITNKPQNNNVEIISHKKNTFSIDVIIKNNTGKNLKQVTIKAECYDKEGNNLGISSNGRYDINTKDKYKISIYCNSETYKYNLKLEYK